MAMKDLLFQLKREVDEDDRPQYIKRQLDGESYHAIIESSCIGYINFQTMGLMKGQRTSEAACHFCHKSLDFG